MKTRVDRYKVRQQMERNSIERFDHLAKIAGVSPVTITKLLQGATFMSNTIDKIASALHCLPKDLVTVDHAPEDLELPEVDPELQIA